MHHDPAEALSGLLGLTERFDHVHQTRSSTVQLRTIAQHLRVTLKTGQGVRRRPQQCSKPMLTCMVRLLFARTLQSPKGMAPMALRPLCQTIPCNILLSER